MNSSSGAIIAGGGNGDSGSFSNTRNNNMRNIMGSHDNTNSPKLNASSGGQH